MERLPTELYIKIFSMLDYHNLANAQKVCRKWKGLASDNLLWFNLFEERWGRDRASFYDPLDTPKPLKCVYEIQDRCDRFGLKTKIVREGGDYYLVHQGEIQHYLGSRQPTNNAGSYSQESQIGEEEYVENKPKVGLLDRILFFLGDLETASSAAKRSRYA